MEFFSKGLKNEFETAMANEPSVFEPPKVYCNNNDDNKSYKMDPLEARNSYKVDP